VNSGTIPELNGKTGVYSLMQADGYAKARDFYIQYTPKNIKKQVKNSENPKFCAICHIAILKYR